MGGTTRDDKYGNPEYHHPAHPGHTIDVWGVDGHWSHWDGIADHPLAAFPSSPHGESDATGGPDTGSQNEYERWARAGTTIYRGVLPHEALHRHLSPFDT
jgi:hypothetical protein